uniref:Uncharacterized protein n=1 Tax=Arundo donax TaxID=35708 RepID=A0A0A8YAW8_ARUDO
MLYDVLAWSKLPCYSEICYGIFPSIFSVFWKRSCWTYLQTF